MLGDDGALEVMEILIATERAVRQLVEAQDAAKKEGPGSKELTEPEVMRLAVTGTWAAVKDVMEKVVDLHGAVAELQRQQDQTRCFLTQVGEKVMGGATPQREGEVE